MATNRIKQWLLLGLILASCDGSAPQPRQPRPHVINLDGTDFRSTIEGYSGVDWITGEPQKLVVTLTYEDTLVDVDLLLTYHEGATGKSTQGQATFEEWRPTERKTIDIEGYLDWTEIDYRGTAKLERDELGSVEINFTHHFDRSK